MGYSIGWLAARTPKATLLDALQLTDTGVPDETHDAPFSVTELPNGWSIVWSNDMEWAGRLPVASLTVTTPVVAFLVDEGIDISWVACAGPDGNWHVDYGVAEDGKLSGEWPATLAPVALAAKTPFDVPVDLALALTGFEYGRFRYDWGEVRFTVAAAGRVDGGAGDR